uniref:Uncharacterized protein n=1 Tax=Arundo donax TaxID=35708 RepID=A0A0A9ASJ0_ARUDO
MNCTVMISVTHILLLWRT